MSAVSAKSPIARLRHDIRTPLNAIIGYSDILLEELDDPGADARRETLRAVNVGGHRLLAGIAQVLHEVEQETDGQLPEGLHHRLARLTAHDIDLLRQQVSFLELDGVAQADVARLRQGVEDLWAMCSERRIAEARRPVPVEERKLQTKVREVTRGRVLVVDDLAENRTLLQRRLQLMGHETALAENGEQALAMLDREPFDLVLLDVLMPGLDGLEVLHRIRSNPATRHVHVIMLSAFDDDAHVVRCIELGADDFVSKPFNPVFLRARVGASLEQKRLRDAEEAARRELERERARAESLLHVILPREIVGELKADGAVRPRRYENVAVMFCDVVEFTRWCDRHEPEQVVEQLQSLVQLLEDIAERHGLQKIKTIGDSFMAAAGLLRPSSSPVLDCVRAALEMIREAQARVGWQLRVGVHVGPVVGGVVGRTQYLFDLWGDTVNTAARIEAHGESGAVCVSAQAWATIAEYCEGVSLPPAELKGKGTLSLWRVAAVREGGVPAS